MSPALPIADEKPRFVVPIGERVEVWLRNLRVLHIRVAYWILSREMQRDCDYARSWQCNIAMPILDNSKLNHEDANRVADVLMRHLFGVKK